MRETARSLARIEPDDGAHAPVHRARKFRAMKCEAFIPALCAVESMPLLSDAVHPDGVSLLDTDDRDESCLFQVLCRPVQHGMSEVGVAAVRQVVDGVHIRTTSTHGVHQRWT